MENDKSLWVSEERLEFAEDKPAEPAEPEKPKFKIGDRVVAKEDVNCFDEFKRIGFNIIGFEEDRALLKPIESFVPKHPEFCNVGRIACKVEFLELYAEPTKPKVTFIGVYNYGSVFMDDGVSFFDDEISFFPKGRISCSKDKVLHCFYHSNVHRLDRIIQGWSCMQVYLISKLGYEIEIIGDGQEEFEKLCKEMDGA
jgi:hypothetical protein